MMSRLYRDKPATLRSSIGGNKRRPPSGKWLLFAGACAVVAGFVMLPDQSDKPLGKQLATPGINQAQAAGLSTHKDCKLSPEPLQRELTHISQGFNGVVGIAVVRADCDWVAGERTMSYFPQQSVSKLWVSLTAMEAVDAGRISLDKVIEIHPADLTLFNQPIRSEVLEKGVATRSVESLMFAALTRSDNTANDRLLWNVSGPKNVRAMFQRKGIAGIRFGPGERLLQSHIAGLNWSPEYSIGRNFEQARARLPDDLRKAALNQYLADPMDGAQPAGIARTLARLAEGQLLSPVSTMVMMDILSKTHSGPRRLKAGAPVGWKVYHKTGTGQELGRLATGYNDVGILQAPDGTNYGVAVMVGQTTVPIPVRMDMMQSVSRAVAQFHEEQKAANPPAA